MPLGNRELRGNPYWQRSGPAKTRSRQSTAGAASAGPKPSRLLRTSIFAGIGKAPFLILENLDFTIPGALLKRIGARLLRFPVFNEPIARLAIGFGPIAIAWHPLLACFIPNHA